MTLRRSYSDGVDLMFASDVTRPVTTQVAVVSSDPPEILEAQPSQIEEVFVKISSPPEDKPKVSGMRGELIECEILVSAAGHRHCQQVQKPDLRPEILFKIKELFLCESD